MKELTLPRCRRCGEKLKIEKIGKTNTGRTVWRITCCDSTIINPTKSYILRCLRKTEHEKKNLQRANANRF